MAPPPSHSQAVLPNPHILLLERIEKHGSDFRLFLSAQQPAPCPRCGQISHSRHSGYCRRLSDLPWQGCSVQLWLNLHKYRCLQWDCPRKVFCERIPGVAQVYARRTERLALIISSVGYVAGGLPAARLLDRLAIPVSDDSVRRQVVRSSVSPAQQAPVRRLGIDDWAWRKYHNYGTILVDLDRHQVVDLLPDRASESVAAWLTVHPTVEIVARDRSGIYADGAATGAPQAKQVADRFHLIANLSAAIERVLEGRTRELTLLTAVEPPAAEPVSSMPEDKPTTSQVIKQQRRQRRLERYQQVTELRRQGYSKRAISQELSLGIKTVRRWLRADQFPERKPPTGRRKKVAEFIDYLDQRWKEGCHNSTLLFTEIRARGYRGSRQMVSAFVASWRHSGDLRRKVTEPQRVAPKHAAILACQQPDKLTPEQTTLLDRLVNSCPDLIELRSIALTFRDIFSTADSAALLQWIQQTKRSCFGPLVRFAYGLEKDILAVRAAVETEYSNGQTEGQINRPKSIKRQMYGRAGFAYLRARVLPSPVLIPQATPSPP